MIIDDEIEKKPRKWIWIVLAVLAINAAAAVLIYSLNRQGAALTEAEGAAISGICAVDFRDFGDISAQVLTKERGARFAAVSKVFSNGDLYAFIVKPIAYNGPVTLVLVIDGITGENLGMRIVDHEETPHYVRDMESPWFTGRFSGKSVFEYLKLVRGKARAENEIVAITGATVTTEGIINGVNAAFGVYREYIFGETAADVPYLVRFVPGEGDGPVEAESLVFRAYGVVLSEIGLDDIRGLPSVKRTMSIHSTAGVTQHSFRGTLLSGIIGLADAGFMEEYSWALAVGVDDYISGISMEEVRAENNVFVMYEDNGKPLPKKNGEPGGMRIVVLDDVFGQRFTNHLLEIVFENEEPY